MNLNQDYSSFISADNLGVILNKSDARLNYEYGRCATKSSNQ